MIAFRRRPRFALAAFHRRPPFGICLSGVRTGNHGSPLVSHSIGLLGFSRRSRCCSVRFAAFPNTFSVLIPSGLAAGGASHARVLVALQAAVLAGSGSELRWMVLNQHRTGDLHPQVWNDLRFCVVYLRLHDLACFETSFWFMLRGLNPFLPHQWHASNDAAGLWRRWRRRALRLTVMCLLCAR